MKFTPARFTRVLPHFDVGQAYYHLVFRTRDGFLNDEEIEEVKNHVIEGDDRFYRLIAVQIMGNHVHIILQPNENVLIQRIIAGIKKTTAKKINERRGTSGNLWSDRYFDRIIRSKDDLDKTLQYLQQNPVKISICENPEEFIGWKFKQE
jgi:REP element-mobilizing transposase RayT